MAKDDERYRDGPRFSLERVRDLVATAIIPATNARDEVRLVLGCSDQAARKYIRIKLRELTERDYVKRFVFSSGPNNGRQADVYCVEDGELSWYVKIRIDDQDLLVVHSFHPPRDPLKKRSLR